MRNDDKRVQPQFSDFVVYVDESGDHGLINLDIHYPIFVLAFCIFQKRYYAEVVVPAVQKFKFDYFGHDLVVLHETDIRKEKGGFTFFQNRQRKLEFIAELTAIIDARNFTLVACVIDKIQLRTHSETPPNPYHLALTFCLESLYEFIEEEAQEQALTHVIVERRGKREDNDLELEFRRICDGANRLGKYLPFEVIFADKRVNSTGLQLADLVARPIGLHVQRADQKNRAFDVLKKKFYGGESKGLKIYPALKSEKPR